MSVETMLGRAGTRDATGCRFVPPRLRLTPEQPLTRLAIGWDLKVRAILGTDAKLKLAHEPTAGAVDVPFRANDLDASHLRARAHADARRENGPWVLVEHATGRGKTVLPDRQTMPVARSLDGPVPKACRIELDGRQPLRPPLARG